MKPRRVGTIGTTLLAGALSYGCFVEELPYYLAPLFQGLRQYEPNDCSVEIDKSRFKEGEIQDTYVLNLSLISSREKEEVILEDAFIEQSVFHEAFPQPSRNCYSVILYDNFNEPIFREKFFFLSEPIFAEDGSYAVTKKNLVLPTAPDAQRIILYDGFCKEILTIPISELERRTE